MAKMFMVDVNGYRVPTDLAAHYRAGYRVLGVKVTQAVGYTWRDGLHIIDEWHKLGKDAHCAVYHFATAGVTGTAQADHFLSMVRPHLRWKDTYCVDMEGQPASYWQWAHGEAKAVHDSFIDRVNATGPRYGLLRRKRLNGLTYGGPYFLRDNGIRKHGGWRLWIAAYVAELPFIPPGWITYMAWQYTDAQRAVPGMPFSLDCSRIKSWLL